MVARMRPPAVTDRELEALIADSREPVAVLFAGGSDPMESERYWKQFKLAAEDWGKSVRFARIDCDENPVALRQWCEIWSPPEIVIFRECKPRTRINYTFTISDLVQKLERVAKAG